MNEIYWPFLVIASEYNMRDNLTPSEIDELVAISKHPTFRTLIKRYESLRSKRQKGQFKSLTFYNVMRPTIILIVTHLDQQLAKTNNIRVQAIVRGHLRRLQDKLEYHVNQDSVAFVNFIKAFPNMSNMELAKYYVANKMNALNNPARDGDVQYINEMLEYVRGNMNIHLSKGSGAIAERESIYAERWLEIFERVR